VFDWKAACEAEYRPLAEQSQGTFACVYFITLITAEIHSTRPNPTPSQLQRYSPLAVHPSLASTTPHSLSLPRSCNSWWRRVPTPISSKKVDVEILVQEGWWGRKYAEYSYELATTITMTTNNNGSESSQPPCHNSSLVVFTRSVSPPPAL
jgi:hypothetical protein